MTVRATARIRPSQAPGRLTGLFGAVTLAEHRQRYGPLPAADGPALIDAVRRAGLRGRGGAGFPTGRKLAAVAAGRRPVVVANGCEGEPASAKDRTLLGNAPHLVLDGAVLAARAVGAARVVLCVHRGSPRAQALAQAVASRPADGVAVEVAQVPRRYVASEESALVHFLNDGEARPTSVPPRPFEKGVGGRPTLVDNVETLAHLALIAAGGPDWFRQLGTDSDPGTSLVTMAGAVAHPAIHEISLGVPLGQVIELAGGPAQELSAVLVGGYFGAWVPVRAAYRLPLSHDTPPGGGPALGAGALVALPAAACGLAETSRVFSYLAYESAGQCGPCQFGLPAVADQLRLLAAGRLDPVGYRRLTSRLQVIAGRGACRHPDGAVRFAASGLAVFEDDVRAHLRGYPCAGVRYPAVLPVPHPRQIDGGWR